MGNTQKSMKTLSGHGVTQFELTTNIVKNLKQFNITPVTKLVLIFLTTHYNEEKNGAVVFPSMPYIAENLGIGLTQTKQAIKDLINEGLIIKSKRDKINGNYNKYLLTLKVQNTTSERSENELFKQSNSDRFCKEQIKRTNKEQSNVVCLKTQKLDCHVANAPRNDEKENQTIQILKDYAIKHGAKNVSAYIKVLQKNGADKRIIQEYKEKQSTENYWHNQAQRTSKLVEEYRNFEADQPTENFKNLKAKLMQICRKENI